MVGGEAVVQVRVNDVAGVLGLLPFDALRPQPEGLRCRSQLVRPA